MDEEAKKEIEIKNITDILLENLRINNQSNDSASFVEYQLLSEEEVNVEHLEFRNPEFGAKLVKKFRGVLHREIRDWTIQPFQKKQTMFNRKINDNLSFVLSQVQSNQKYLDSLNVKVDTNQETIHSVNEKVDSVNVKVDNVTLTIEQTIEIMIEKKFISLRETFEIESIVKSKFLEILKRYPRIEDLQYFVNEIKEGKINVIDFEIRLRNTQEYKDIRLLEHGCIYTKFGTKMYLNKKDNVVSKDLAIKHVWEPNETEILRRSIKTGMNVIDIGSNIGYYTLLFSKWVGKNGHVFSFEPESDNFKLLQKNLIANQIKNAKVYQKAVSNQNESTILFLSEENKGDHKIIDLKEEDLEKIIIESVTLDSSEASKFPIDLIKMDIQGAEMLALNGMTKILKENPKITILTEFWPYGIEKSGYPPKEFFNKLENLGFEIMQIKDEELMPINNKFKLLTEYQNADFVNLLCKR